ncbi:CAMK family protein kinase [Tritrichomonas foetus]|uniref:non-specific serine/threonine protein kinase n=1 Tax=Tritrichomonas foetus TaxID=1144522 RepID=A0A1J4JGZ5_9EUKA|nr:CAMK family protein kinase [Tritrichomonas foetus]|eukprot:OHS98440.1 CAMK family protein kinase [Tritrichomonas foetus]
MSGISDYNILQSIGTGTFANVYLGEHKQTNIKVAIKKISKFSFTDPGHENRFYREVELIRGMDHPFVAEFFDVFHDEKNFYIVMEYVENGNLLDYVNTKGELIESHARHYFCQLISVLEYLHEQKKVAHRDLKAENVLLDKNYNIRLIDFGLSNYYTDENPYLATACGSPAYACPEMICGQKYTIASDIWSAGILLYAITVGELPYDDDNMIKLLQKIAYAEPEYPKKLSSQLQDLLQRMLKKDPGERITLTKIKEHPWFSQYKYSEMMNKNFGIDFDWRVLNNSRTDSGNSQEIDCEVVQILTSIGYNCSDLINCLYNHDSSLLYAQNNALVVYRMLRKYKITCQMNEISLATLTMKKLTIVENSTTARVHKKQIFLPGSLLNERKLIVQPVSPLSKNVLKKGHPEILTRSQPFPSKNLTSRQEQKVSILAPPTVMNTTPLAGVAIRKRSQSLKK